MRGMHDDRLDPSTLEERLRGGRYTPTDAALNRLSRSARSDRQPRGRTEFWRSRLALVVTLVFGIGLLTTGGAFAVSGFSSGNDAAKGQYGNGCKSGQKQNPQGKCVPNCDKGKKKGNKHCTDVLGESTTDGRGKGDVHRSGGNSHGAKSKLASDVAQAGATGSDGR